MVQAPLTLYDDYMARLAPWSDIQDCMERLYDAAASYPEVQVLELGVRGGNSTAAFLAAAEAVSGHVWSADIEQPQVPSHWAASGYWTLTIGDDMHLPLPDRMFDILFIDTSHAYYHTLAELRRHVPLVAPGGRVLLHDTRLEAPELVGPQPPFPVAKAVTVFCEETGREWADHDAQYGLGEIVRPNG